MSTLSRRRFVAASAGFPLLMRGDGLNAAEEPRMVEIDLAARQDWVALGSGGGHRYAYAFNKQVPGPVVEARPGDRLVLRFRNDLQEPTNLHFHGLHVPSTGTADNVMRQVAPGESFTYDFGIPANHHSGTFWYHPHVHEYAARQVSRGLAGLLIIRGELDQIPEIAAAPEQFVVLQDFDFDRSGLPVEPNMMEQMIGREGALVTVNGQVNPSLAIQAGGWLRLRILNASSSRFYRLSLAEHPLQVIATDGGPLSAPEPRDEVLLAPGERIEAMVHAIRPNGAYRLENLHYDRGVRTLGSSPAAPTATLATLDYQDTAASTWDLPKRLVTVDSLPRPSIRRTFYLGSGMGMGMGMMGSARAAFTINGRSFNPARVDTTVKLDSIEDWEFVNPSMMDHPMHIHTNPFQLVDSGGLPAKAWKDVVVVPKRSRVRVRTAFRDFVGATMYHCHILDHEDLGMMGVLQIEG